MLLFLNMSSNSNYYQDAPYQLAVNNNLIKQISEY